MRLAAKNKSMLQHIHKLYLQGEWFEMCNEIHYYGEFDWAFDMLRRLEYKYKSEQYRSDIYHHIVELYFSPYYNKSLNYPSSGERRRDSYMDFYLGKSYSIKEITAK